uniref:Uracil-DNA glycosylase n=1 Tax=Babesia bovis TaxID=5865 RepID=S6B0C2_BABBO|nr:uracil-DNA glycosylase family protein [Babesia bovis]
MSKRLITDFFDIPRQNIKRRDVGSTLSRNSDPDKEDSDLGVHSTGTALQECPRETPGQSATGDNEVVPLVSKLLGEEWSDKLNNEIKKPYFANLWAKVNKDRKTKRVYPPEHLVFNAFQLVPLSKVKVVIVGQDPYHQPKQAMGLSFSVPRGVAIPPSLRNIYKEIGIERSHGDLTYWAQQGVFLLNTVLTVIESQPFSHKDYGWTKFTDLVIDLINTHRENVVFLLWGKSAEQKCSKISTSRHCILKCGHPSPLSQKLFLGCEHFNKCNEYLRNTKQKPID